MLCPDPAAPCDIAWPDAVAPCDMLCPDPAAPCEAASPDVTAGWAMCPGVIDGVPPTLGTAPGCGMPCTTGTFAGGTWLSPAMARCHGSLIRGGPSRWCFAAPCGTGGRLW